MNIAASAGRITAPLIFGLVYFAVFAGNNIWRFTFHNYTIETFHISALQIGFLFSLSAVPGVLAFSIGLIARKIRLFVLMILSCTLVGVGLIWIGFAPDWNLLWPGVLAISVGFTVFYPVINSLALQGSAPENTSISMGRLKSFGPLAAIASALLILYILQPMGYRNFLIITGGIVLLCGVVAAFDTRKKKYAGDQGNLSFRIALWPYYALNFLAGCRSAFFKTFVLFLLVNEYHLPIHKTALVVLVGSFCGFLSYRLIGQIANRYEPRNVLSVIYMVVALIFEGFGAFEQEILLSALYCFDSLLFGVSVVTDSHLKKISRPQNFVGDVAVGLTLFHLAGVLFPLAGGVIWEYLGKNLTFLFGSFLAGLAALVSRKLAPAGK